LEVRSEKLIAVRCGREDSLNRFARVCDCKNSYGKT
jgi:hypothetical protein